MYRIFLFLSFFLIFNKCHCQGIFSPILIERNQRANSIEAIDKVYDSLSILNLYHNSIPSIFGIYSQDIVHAEMAYRNKPISYDINNDKSVNFDYFIQISSRRSVKNDEKSNYGHTFILFSRRNGNSSHSVVDRAFGYYPNNLYYLHSVFLAKSFNVKGKIKDEITTHDNPKGGSDFVTNKIIIQVDSKTYHRGIIYANDYKKTYHIIDNNCIHFVNQFAINYLDLNMSVNETVKLGFENGNRSRFLPDLYVSGLKAQFLANDYYIFKNDRFILKDIKALVK